MYYLLFCNQFGLTNVIIESDSTVAVGWANSIENRPWKLANDLNYLDHLKHVVLCVGIRHFLRERNIIADYLAKTACDLDDTI